MTGLFGDEKQLSTAGYAQVAIERSIDTGNGLTYAIPEGMEDLQVGQRVVVPLGRRDKPTGGYVVDIATECDLKKVKAIIKRDTLAPSLPEDLIELGKWIGSYYCCPLGMVIGTMLPAAVKRAVGRSTETVTGLATDFKGIDECGVKLTKLQKQILQQLIDHNGELIELRELAERGGAKTAGPVKKLIDMGLLQARQRQIIRTGYDDLAVTSSETDNEIELTDDQRKAIEHLADQIHAGFSVNLLYGVTGSGKTEVYLRAIEHVLAGQPESEPPGGVIVLVPEIALTPQTAGRFLRRFDGVAVLHSALTSAQRHQQWQRIRCGQANIVVGARSAIFAPLKNLKLIIVDEEHESSYKQDQLPRYSARDVAVKRGQLSGVPVILGSATPSLESYYNAICRKSYHLLELPSRVAGAVLPQVELIDMVNERRHRKGIHLLSQRLERAMRNCLDTGAQVMLLLNRRGYANYIACPDHRCGWMQVCDSCDATMVYHKNAELPLGGVVRCHHCTAEQLLPQLCPTCGRKVTVFGLGTQRVEEELQRKFDGVSFLRMDSDVMRTGRDYHQTLERFRQGEVKVLIGTQMIAKGLDFPNVRLVGVISADTSLHMPDFRAAERTFQLISQVAGRAGRGDKSGLVIVQSFNPEDAAIKAAAAHDFKGFAQHEMQMREEVGLPPVSRMARIVVRHLDYVACCEHAQQLADQLETFNRQTGEKVRLRGPMPCPIARIADHHRQQIEMIATEGGSLQQLMTGLRNQGLLKADAHTAVDVDPISLL